MGAISFAQEGNEEEEIEGSTSEKQTARERKGLGERRDAAKKEEEQEKPPISDYKIITFENDTTFVDTTLTIQKDYNFNYLRKDDFGLMPLNNVGQAYNSLVKTEEADHMLPLFGARARHFNFIEAEDVTYYHVPTPLTELYFKTTFEQGQQLDALIAINTSPRLNLSIAYKGVRSLGKYQHALASTGNFRSTANYSTKNERYKVRTHFVAQDLLNEEYGGLSATSSTTSASSGVEEYLGLGQAADNRDDFEDRSSIQVNFTDAESTLLGKRFYLDHSYAIIKSTDSSDTSLSLGHVLDLTDKSFTFNQTTANDLFGTSYEDSELSNKVALEDFSNKMYVAYTNPWIGTISLHASNSNYNYGYNTILRQVDEEGNEINITNRIKGDAYAAGGSYVNNYKGFLLSVDGSAILAGDIEGNYLNAGAGYDLNDKYGASISIHSNSVLPNYNFLLHQSDYVSYNWQNFNNEEAQNNFTNIETQKIKLHLKAKNIAAIDASYTTIKNHTYFTKSSDSITTPLQYGENVNLLKVKLSQNLDFGFIGLDNTIMYQNVSEGDEVYNVPEIVTRNSLYYKDYWFKSALYLQTGVTFKYYSQYTADGYDPVLSEFYVQSAEEQTYFENNAQRFGGFPQFDIFFNAKIRQTRIYFKVENFGEAFQQNTEFSAPGYAPRDAVIRFGLVWNFFL
ncbi:putative porin [Aquimarina addita]|uniref:Porin n=1 Tax=Aquimarina addita TaxID=870485 RepID=A0ABP6UVK8_9FLAO